MRLSPQMDIDKLRAAGEVAAIASNNEALQPRRASPAHHPLPSQDDILTRVLQPPPASSRPPSAGVEWASPKGMACVRAWDGSAHARFRSVMHEHGASCLCTCVCECVCVCARMDVRTHSWRKGKGKEGGLLCGICVLRGAACLLPEPAPALGGPLPEQAKHASRLVTIRCRPCQEVCVLCAGWCLIRCPLCARAHTQMMTCV